LNFTLKSSIIYIIPSEKNISTNSKGRFMKKIFTVFLFFLLTQSAFSAEKMRIAIMDLKSDSLSQKTVSTISNMLRTELINIGSFVVVERGQMDAILKEQGLQQTGCTDQSCVVEMGKLLSAKKILVGEVSTLGKAIIITIRVVDVEKGVSEFGSSEKADSEDNLDKAVYSISRKLSSVIEGKQAADLAAKPKDKKQAEIKTGKEKPETKITSGYIMRGFVPGWAQIYSGHTAKGIAFGSAFLGTAAWTVYAILNYNKSKNDYESLAPGLTVDKYTDFFKKYDKNGKIALYSIAGVSAIYVINWIDVLFFSAPEAEKQAGIFKSDNVFVNLDVFPENPEKITDMKTLLSATIKF
jgi:hypothetical protein